VLKGSKLAEALGYGLNQWDGLARYLDDGRIEIDSNTVERSIRPLALTRKNALFAGHDLGAQAWAMTASLIETCKSNGIDPLAWMTDVLKSRWGGGTAYPETGKDLASQPTVSRWENATRLSTSGSE
jgi:hypothetical protein